MTRAHKIANLIGVPLPLVGLVAAIVLLWNQAIGPLELGLLVGLYGLTALGVTLGYHRLFTHRAFESSRVFRAIVAVLGSMAMEGSVITWVADHHNHHAFPTSAFHGLRWWERLADPTGLLIALFEKLGIVWNVVRVSPERQRARSLPGRGKPRGPRTAPG